MVPISDTELLELIKNPVTRDQGFRILIENYQERVYGIIRKMVIIHEVQKYLTLANIQYSDQFLVGNSKMIESWDEKTRNAFMEAVAEANRNARELNEAQVEKRIAFLEEQGMEVIRPSEENLAEFQSIGQPAYLKWLKERGIEQRWVDMALEDAGVKR